MVKKVGKFLSKVKGGRKKDSKDSDGLSNPGGSSPSSLGVIRKGNAMRVIFFYPGEEGTYVDNADVTLFENGIIHIQSNQEETTTHLQNCEILWRFETDAEERANKVRLLKPSREGRGTDSNPEASQAPHPDSESDLSSSPGPSEGNSPDLR